MTHAPLRSLRATTALCAVLALGSTPAWAQDAATVPDAVVAPASPSAAPQPAAPTIQLPTQAPAPAAPVMTSQPMVQQTPQVAPAPVADEAAPARTSAERRPAARTVTVARSAAPQAASAPVVTARGAEPVVTSPVAPLPPAASVPLAQPAVPAAIPASSEDVRLAADSPLGLSPGAWVAALIALFGAGGAAYFAMRSSRRRRDAEVYDEGYEAVPSQTYVEPVPAVAINEPTGGLEPEAPLPAFATVGDYGAVQIEPRPAQAAQAIGTEELVPATTAATDREPQTEREPLSAGAIEMPSGPIPRGEERDELLHRMVAAAPDASNPFRSHKARLRRARLILQSLDQQHKDQATQPFDWRTYQPAASNPAPATPPLVDA